MTTKSRTAFQRLRNALNYKRVKKRALKLAGRIDPLHSPEASYAILIVTVGLIGGLTGVIYRGVQRLYQGIIFASQDDILTIAERLPWQQRLLYPAAGALLAAIVLRYGLKGGRSEGLTEIMEAVVLKEKALRFRQSVWKGVSSLVAIGSGMSLGREGPMAQVTAAAAGRISEILHISTDKRRVLIGCGVAAGMSAAYNAPIGASLFVMEVIAGNFAMDIFGPLVIASVVSTLLTYGILGSAIYETPGFELVSTWEFVFFVILGIGCALVGRIFISTLFGVARLPAKIPAPPWAIAIIGGLGVGAIAIYVPQILGNGYEGVDQMLKGSIGIELLAWMMAGKILATAFSLGSGSPGGVFTPTIFTGAALGGLMGSAAHTLWPAHTAPPGAYALVGMAGLLAATTHAPIMSTLIVFEMSLNYKLILPVMVCAGVAALISRSIRKDSIYTERLRRRGVDIDLAIEETALQSIKVEDVMWADPPTAKPNTSLRALMDQFLHMRGGGPIHVVDGDRHYVGLIDVHDLLAAADQKEVGDLLIAGDLARMVPYVSPGEPVSRIMEKFWFQEYGQLPVLSGATPPLFHGIVTRRDVLRAFDREVLQRKLLTVRYDPEDGAQRGRGSTVDLPEEFAIQELPVPPSLQGRTLIDLDLPHRFLLTALALKSIDGQQREIIPPPADKTLVDGDRLVLVGRRQDLARFSNA